MSTSHTQVNAPTRDQRRALLAYESSKLALKDQCLKDYKIAVNDLGPHIMRSGLAATLSFLERDKSTKAIRRLLNTFSRAELPGLDNVNEDDFCAKVRQLSAPQYMLVTRELLALTVWLKRAVQATDAAAPVEPGGNHATHS